jgi:ABC transporter related protein
MKMKTEEGTRRESASFFKELGGFMRPYRGGYSSSVIISVLSVLLNIGGYILAGKIVVELFESVVAWNQIVKIGIILALCKLGSGMTMNLSTWLSHQAAFNTLRDIRTAFTKKMLRLPLGNFEENGSGRLKTMLVDNIEGIEKTLAHMLPEMTGNLAGPLFLIVLMFLIDWRVALVMTLWILLGFSVTMGMMRGYEEKFRGQLKASKSLNQAIVEFVNGIEVIKNFGRTKESYFKFVEAIKGHADYNVNWMRETQVYSSLGMAIAPFSIFPVLISGLIFWSDGSLETPMFFLMMILSFGIFAPLMTALTYVDQAAQMGTYAKEIREVLNYPELKRGNNTEFNNIDIEFKNVSFSYGKSKCEGLDDGIGKSDKKAVDNVSFKIKEGSMMAFVGPSGGGKSTLGKLLAGFWDPDEGSITIGGLDMREYTQEALNERIAFVDQDTFLFDKTIRDNIRLGRPDATDGEVEEAAKRAGCHEFISRLPKGYETMAGSAGGSLSGGERQRITIARAMMKNAPIMIMDEATSSSDPENEASIQEALSVAAKGKTLIVIAHRLMTVKNANKIAYIENGRIKYIGTHEEMMLSCKDYRMMWELSEEDMESLPGGLK